MMELVVVDDALEDPAAYRACALEQSFADIQTTDYEIWRGIVLLPIGSPVLAAVRSHLPAAIARLEFLRKSPIGQAEPNFIHSDEGMGTWTAILYLNPDPPPGDGTTFWRFLPTGAVYGSAGALEKDDRLWQSWRHVDAKFNRLVLFDARYFHSRGIRENYGIGDEARLIQVAFGVDGGMIRRAELEDVPAIVALGLRFLRGSVYADRLPENPDQMARLAEYLITSADGLLLVATKTEAIVGMIGVAIFTHHLSGARTAGELFYWVNPEARGPGVRLLRLAEQWARALGAATLQMIAPTPAIGKFYERFGFHPWEIGYVKELASWQ